jgi:hypothetical protein
MKNIHIIPTDVTKNDSYTNQNIYITSDEEIKVGDWCIDKHNVVYKQETDKIFTEFTGAKKIILTTDFTLAPDVHKIPDEFLEWFVKNPSCESVEVKKQYVTPLGDIVDFCYDNERLNYKIIIPKEEQKQDYSGVHLRHCYQGEYEDGCKYGEDDCPAKPLEPKQETLTYSEAAKNNYPDGDVWTIEQAVIRRLAFMNGAKWQHEQAKEMDKEQQKQMLIGLLDWMNKVSQDNPMAFETDSEDIVDMYLEAYYTEEK